MPVRLSEEEVVTIGVGADKGKNHCEIARTLGVSEGTVRYHLRRQAEEAQDGRRQKGFQAEALARIIAASWIWIKPVSHWSSWVGCMPASNSPSWWARR